MLVNKSIFSDKDGNALRVSSVIHADQEVNFNHFSAKYVVSGNENYTINNKKFDLKEGDYVIGNRNTNSKVFIDQPAHVNGICVDISKEIISEIIDYNYKKPSDFSRFLFEQDWMVQKYNTKNTQLGYALSQIATEFENLKNGSSVVNRELFFSIGECMVKDQSRVFESFNRLTSVKEETNGRLFNFVYDAKKYIDENFLENIDIEKISREAKLSEYHFIRLFKDVFNTTPYKYVIQKRLELALELLNNQYKTSEISSILGYTDIPAFSKAFKNQYGYSPSAYKTN